jgi:hypothetical protein
MNEDPLALARRFVNIFPHLRDTATAAAVVSAVLYAALVTFEPLIKPKMSGYLQSYPPSTTNLFLLILGTTVALSWLFHRFNKKARQEAEFERIVDVLERAMAKGQYTKIERKAVWREIVNRLAQEAKLDARPPGAGELAAAAARGLSDLASKT